MKIKFEPNLNPRPRQEKIVAWLAQTPLVGIPLKGGKGFFVNNSSTVTLQEGRQMAALDWLFSEQFHDGMSIAGYSVVHTRDSGEYQEKLTFFLSGDPIDAPF